MKKYGIFIYVHLVVGVAGGYIRAGITLLEKHPVDIAEWPLLGYQPIGSKSLDHCQAAFDRHDSELTPK